MRRRKVVVEVAKRAGEDMDMDMEAQARAFEVPSTWKDSGFERSH